jgi:hypothetical protein
MTTHSFQAISDLLASPAPDSRAPEPTPRSPGLYEDIPEVEYHRDTLTLSFSGAKTLLKAPALFRYQQTHPVQSNAFDFGSAAHALVLGAGEDSIYVAPYDTWQTKAAQTERRLAREMGLSPVLPADWLVVCDMADELARHRLASQLLSEGNPEVSAYALDEPTGVTRRGRFDWLGPRVVTDYKTAATADPYAFGRTAAAYSYHQQASWYLDLAADIGHPAEAFAFIVQMKDPPYLVSVVELDARAIDRGRELNRRALEMFRDCMASDLWPGFIGDDTFATVSLPAWAFYDDHLEN